MKKAESALLSFDLNSDASAKDYRDSTTDNAPCFQFSTGKGSPLLFKVSVYVLFFLFVLFLFFIFR